MYRKTGVGQEGKRRGVFGKSLEPALALEVPKHAHCNDEHQNEDGGITPPLLKFRHVPEVHAVEADDERQGNEDGRDDGEHLHHLIGTVGDAGDVQVGEAGKQIAVRFHCVHSLNGMVAHIAEEEPRLFMEQAGVFIQKAQNHLADGPYGTAQDDDLLFQIVDPPDDVPVRFCDDLFLKELRLLADLLKDIIKAVHERAEQGIDQVVRTGHARPTDIRPDPIAQVLKDISGVLLKEDHEPFAMDDAHLFFRDLRCLRVYGEHARDDIDDVIVALELGPLIRVDDVLKDKRVQVECGGDLFQSCNIFQSGHIDPLHATASGTMQYRGILHVLFRHLLRGIRHPMDRGGDTGLLHRNKFRTGARARAFCGLAQNGKI